MRKKQRNTLCLIFAGVDRFCKHLRRVQRKGGPKPKISKNQILKMIVLKYLLGFTSDRSYIRFLNNLGKGLFKNIPEHSWFNRRSKELLPTYEVFRQYLLKQLDVDHLVRIIDSTPVPVVRYSRSRGRLAKSFERANFGYCASQKEKYFGFKLHLLTTLSGIPTDFDLTEASLPDVKMLEELTSSFEQLITIGDKGYQGFELKKRLLAEKKHVIVPDKKGQIRQLNSQADNTLLKFRKRIEITIAQLKDQFHIAKLRARTTMGLVTRIMGVMLAMTIAIWTNRLLDRPDCKIKELLC